MARNAGGSSTIESIHEELVRQAGRKGPVVLRAAVMPSDELWHKTSIVFGEESFLIEAPDGGEVRVGEIRGNQFTIQGLVTVLGLEKQARTITIRVEDGEPGFSFDIGPLAPGWTFGKWQPLLGTTPLNRLQQTGIRFHWDSHRPMDERNSPLIFAATVELSGPFAFLTRFISGQSLAWRGPILYAEAWDYKPVFDLRAPLIKDGSEPETFSIGFLKVKSPYLQARAVYMEDPETDGALKLMTFVQFGMSLQEEGMTLRPMTLHVPIYSNSNVLYLNGFYGEEGDALSMGDVARWLLNLDEPLSLPAPLDGLFNRVGLKSMSAAFTSSLPFGLMSVSVMVGSKSDQPVWDIYNNQIVLEELYMNSNVTYLTANDTSVNALFGADLRVFDLLFETELEMQNNDVIARGMLRTVDGLPLSFSGLISKLNCGLDTRGLDDFFALSFNHIGAELVPAADQFRLSVYAEADLSLRFFGKELLGLHETKLLFSGFQNEEGELTYLVYASGRVALFGLTFPAQLTLSARKKQFIIGPVSFSFGDIIKYLVQLIHPAWDFELPEPWNVLNSIGFRNAVLTVDMTEKAITFSSGIQADFGFIEISDISLTYYWRTPKGGKEGVVLSLDGTFLGMPIRAGEEDEPLEWDVVNGQPPEVPGAGKQLFHLEYLGIGQHVSFRDTSELHTIQDVITALERSFRPELAGGNPLEKSDTLIFNENSGWLLGAKFTVLDMVTIAAIFNDPQMYGLRISLAGERAGSFKGLEFEILYKKITDQIGLYHTELVLPDVMRYLEFGKVSITIPVIGIDIYTNGNFKIDIGFPTNGNFERSFAIQVFPFVGFGGFYLAYLEGATSRSVPVIDNGEFKPVIEFGFGLAIGVGKTIHKGPLSAGLSLTVQGILEGTLAWYHPTASEEATDLYYAVQGMVGIVGELFGSLDFSIIKASVQLRASASALLVFQAYEPIIIRFEVKVEASVKIKVLFITIHFSFNWTLREQFTIGEKGLPPWRVVSDQRLLSAQGAHEKKRLKQPRAASLSQWLVPATKPSLSAILAEPALQWNTPRLHHARLTATGEDAKYKIEVQFGVWYTQASGRLPEGEEAERPSLVQALPLLFVANAIPPQVSSRAALQQTDGGDSDFSRLVEGMLLRAIDARLASTSAAYTGDEDTYVSLYDLDVIYQHLLAGLADEHFTYNNLTAYFQQHMTFVLKPAQPVTEGEAPSGTMLPMIPALALESSDGQVQIDYGKETRLLIGESYAHALEQYFQTFTAAYQSELEQANEDNPKVWKKQNAKLRAQTQANTQETINMFLFRDYFLMITKSAVQAAIDRLTHFHYESTGTLSLDQIATTLSAHKAQPGLTNPTALSIALANQDRKDVLNPASRPLIAGAVYQTRDADSIKRIAGQYGISPAQLLAAAGANGVLLNADDAGLLRRGTRIELGTISYAIPRDGYPLEAVAFSFGTSFEVLKAANPGAENAPLIQGQALVVPDARHTIETGQTLRMIAEQFGLTLAQLAVASQDNAEMLQPLSLWHIPEFPAEINEGMSLRELAERYALSMSDIVESGLGQADDLLLAGKQLAVPNRPDMPKQELIAAVIHSSAVNEIAASISRFFMHGLRIPAPAHTPDFSQLFPLYQVIGQQWNAPPPDTEHYAYTLTKAEGTSWIQFAGNDEGVHNSDASEDGCTYTFGPGDWETIRAYAAPFTPEAEEPQPLALLAYQPNRYALSLMISWQHPLGSRLWEQTENEEASIGQPAIWPFPPSLKERLLHHSIPSAAQAEQTGLRYTLKLYRQDVSHAPATAEHIQMYAWATMIEVRIRAVQQGEAGSDRPVQYELVGTDEDGKQTLQHLWGYLASDAGQQDQIVLSWLYPANPSEPNSSGMLSGMCLPEETFLLKANLSTTTHSSNDPVLLREHVPYEHLNDPELDVFATLADAKRFIQLLWEGSAVHSGGYYLHYMEEDGSGLPAAIFNDRGEASLKLAIVLDSQIDRISPSESMAVAGDVNAPIYGFNNCAITAQSMDLSLAQLAVEAALYETVANETLQSASNAMGLASAVELALANRSTKLLLKPGVELHVGSTAYKTQSGDTLQMLADRLTDGQLDTLTLAIGATEGLLLTNSLLQYHDGQMSLHATAPIGAVGYDQLRPHPDATDLAYADLSAHQQLSALYQLLGYTMHDNDFFTTAAAGGGEGLPAGPIHPPGEKGDQPAQEWYYRNIIQASRFAKSDYNDAYRTAGLPPAAGNPYAGLAPQSHMKLSLSFQDLFGNRLDDSSLGADSLHLPFAYRDALLPLSMWPGMTVSYNMRNDARADHTGIEFCISPNLGAYVGGSGQSLTTSRQTIQTDMQKLAQLYYQFVQPDYQVAWQTSLDQSSMEEDAALHFVWKAPWWQAIVSHWLFLQSLERMRPVDVQPAPDQTLGELAASYLVTAGELLEYNAQRPADQLFELGSDGLRMTVPEKLLTRQGDSLQALCARSGGSISAVQLAEQNADAVLFADQIYRTPARTLPHEGTELVIDGQSLQELAKLLPIAPLRTAEDNAERTDLLREGAILRLNGRAITVREGYSLSRIVALFKQYEVISAVSLQAVADFYQCDVATIAEANQAEIGIWRDQATFTYEGHTVQAKSTDSLYDIAEAFAQVGLPVSVTALAASVKDNDQLLANGAVLLTGLHGVDLGDVVHANVQVSNLFKPQSVLRVTHIVVRPSDTLATLQNKEGLSAAELVPLNVELANFFAEGVYLFIRNNPAYVPSLPGATLAQIVHDTAASYEELGQLNEHLKLQATQVMLIQVPLRTRRPDVGQTWLVPYAAEGVFPSASMDTLSAIAAQFSLDGASTLAEWNEDMPYLFQPGTQVRIAGKPHMLTESDTFASLLKTFPDVDKDELVAGLDQPHVLRAGAVFVVPAPRVTESLLRPQVIAEALHVSAEDLLQANRSLSGLLQKDVDIIIEVPGNPQAITLATREGETLNTLLAQFQRYGGSTITFAMMAEAAAQAELFLPGANYVLPPRVLTLHYETRTRLPDKIFPLHVEVALRRVQYVVTDEALSSLRAEGASEPVLQKLELIKNERYLSGDQFRAKLRTMLGVQWNELPLDALLRLSAQLSELVASTCKDTPAVFAVSTQLSPALIEQDAGSDAGLRRFARQFERALKSHSREVKLAVGVGKREWNAEGQKNKLWAVVFGEEGYQARIQADQTALFSMKPLSTSLISRQARMQYYVPGEGLVPAESKMFHAVEVDLWAKQFLETLDLVLTAPYAVPAASRNRRAVEQLLASKTKLADKLATAVVPVLHRPPYAGDVTIARQQFADRLKIRLADAYAIEAIVQFPTAVAGGAVDPAVAPRLSGKPVNVGIRTGAVETIASLAEVLHVSQEFLLDAVERMTGILHTGGDGKKPAVVRYSAEGVPDQTVTLAAGMTLHSLARDHLGLDSVYGLINCLTVIEGDSLFAPHAAMNLTPVNGIVGQTAQAPVWVAENSLESMAFFFNLTVQQLARAVQDVRGLFAREVTELTFEGRTVAVTAGDSLRTVAAKLGTSSEALAEYYRLRAHLLQAGLELHSLQVLPQYELSTAKIPLSEPLSHLTYFVDVKTEHQARKLFFHFDYVINEMEFDIHPMSGIADYQASSWLSFVLPFARAGGGVQDPTANIGQKEIPILLRSYPDIPTLLNQQGEGVQLESSANGVRLFHLNANERTRTAGDIPSGGTAHPSKEEKDELDALRSWTYSSSFHVRPSGQDEMRLTVSLNDVREGEASLFQSGANNEPFDFFESLAQFASNLPALQTDLEQLPSMDRESASDTADSAITVLAELVSQIANTWPTDDNRLLTASAVGAVDTHEYALLMRRDIARPEVFRTLIFRAMEDVEENVWPDHVWFMHEEQWVELDAQRIEPGAQEAVFTFPLHIEASGSLTLKVGFDQLNVIRYQSASSSMAVTRNRHLISTGETAAEFVYETPQIAFANPLTPLIVRSEIYELRGPDLEQCLSELFRRLLDADNPAMWNPSSMRHMGLTCGYQFSVSHLPDTYTTVPMFHYPFYPFKVMEDYKPVHGTFVNQLAAAMYDWLHQQKLAANTGKLVFDLIVYEAATAGETPHPVLELENIHYSLDQMRDEP